MGDKMGINFDLQAMPINRSLIAIFDTNGFMFDLAAAALVARIVGRDARLVVGLHSSRAGLLASGSECIAIPRHRT